MRVRIGLVTENTTAFLNQVKLNLFSLRKNGGALKDAPVVLVSIGEELVEQEQQFLKEQFGPIEFRVMPRLGAISHTSKLNVLYACDPAEYDVLVYMDCDTAVAGELDEMLEPIRNGEADFLCRRGGTTDRNRFVDFDALVERYCAGGRSEAVVVHQGRKEWPMFNTGVFAATSGAVRAIRSDAVEFTYRLFHEWQVRHFVEELPGLKQLYTHNVLWTGKPVLESWPIEQGALALACIRAGVRVQYLDEVYNSWGNLEDLKILHCFKSAYQFDRAQMFSNTAEHWISEYQNSGVPGKVFLSRIVSEYKARFQ